MTNNKPNERIQELAHRWLTGTLTEAEQQEFDRWFSESADTPLFIPEDIAPSKEMHRRALLARVHQKAKIKHRQTWLKPYWPAVAAVLLAVFTGSYLYWEQGLEGNREQERSVVDVAPGSNRATLTLADGRTVGLSEEQMGIIAGDHITYVDGSPVLGEQESKGTTLPRSLQLATPKGGTYQVILSDGTKVWLNAASVLTYPDVFPKDERVVEIRGEGYFEVAEDKKRPFKVISDGQEINVLGTKFNISAYPEEPETRTTLVSGTVSVLTRGMGLAGAQQSVVLRPGEEAVYMDNRLQSRQAYVASVIGWKDGLFVFSGTELRQAIRQLSRWYNLEVEYRGQVPVTYFSGEIEMSSNLSSVLEILRESRLNFKIEAGEPVSKLIIMP